LTKDRLQVAERANEARLRFFGAAASRLRSRFSRERLVALKLDVVKAQQRATKRSSAQQTLRPSGPTAKRPHGHAP
jgi:hypothetical protein